LGKTAVETVTILKEVVKNKSMSKHKCMSGLITLKEVKYLLKTSHVVDPFPQAEMTKMYMCLELLRIAQNTGE
jgi:hypothetical protein